LPIEKTVSKSVNEGENRPCKEIDATNYDRASDHGILARQPDSVSVLGTVLADCQQ
jgi:hypothetical protein